ncbi:unnamed protein product [Mytilus coruscus]|uniref:Kazal-like domain-containing protein n=1 Tax=Mytilus coruscus TaxID=42192 RepID=A0A6J8BWJ2_MYTCO|nr:unnamed protein product [Mytilus coruscus]
MALVEGPAPVVPVGRPAVSKNQKAQNSIGGPVFSTKTSREFVFKASSGKPAPAGSSNVNRGPAKAAPIGNSAPTVKGSAPAAPLRRTSTCWGSGCCRTNAKKPTPEVPVAEPTPKVPVAKPASIVPVTEPTPNVPVEKQAPEVPAPEAAAASSTQNKMCSWSPICGNDGSTYPSNCVLPSGVGKACDGYCPCKAASTCGCEQWYSPLCGVDGVTYDNECELLCAGVDKDCDGTTCPCGDNNSQIMEVSGCGCSNNWDPVCSQDGHTYRNLCLAKCSGISEPDLACSSGCPC